MTDPAPNAPQCLHAALALELAPGSQAGVDALDQHAAGALAGHIARDLAGLAPQVTALSLHTVGAHYDPAELLRPGWPLHTELAHLAARAPGAGQARVIAFGAHAGTLPGTLTPNAELAGGPLRLIPVVLEGASEVTGVVGTTFEDDLLERGMAGAQTALFAQEAFGLTIEHARYLTLHDLCAMTALQYQHAGLEPLWPVLETALLAAGETAWLDAPPEPLLHYTRGEVRMALFAPDAWRARYGHGSHDEARLTRAYQQFEARQRQIAALLQAHAVPVTFVHCPAGTDPRGALDD